MIDRSAAAALLDFSTRIGAGHRADEQLDGAVALHNLLCRNHVAYLADEVGMGKTYVALGALALFRHYDPRFRVLILSPRENIQRKWMKEMGNFVANNVRFADMRVKALDGRPARPLVACANLVQLLAETITDPERDFFARMTSFSLPTGAQPGLDSPGAGRLRDALRQYLPWLSPEIFDLRDKKGFKDNVARAICCALPVFDLVIVDEAHNLKHGFSETVAARNRVLGLVFGHPGGAGDSRLFPHYRPRARRVLFLSATPVEDDYSHLWNQLNVFNLGQRFSELRDGRIEEAQKKEIARRFLIRRVTSIRVAGSEHTKNLYRREWRSGGVVCHDQPIRLTDDRQRLVVALVQKKVSELLGSERFNNSFQIGMLASFESFLATAKVNRAHDDQDEGVFDQNAQTEDELEREGIDVRDVNRLANDYRRRFNGQELPHPKMDAVVTSLSQAWETGTKTLIFVRRVASVKELKRKLDASYDDWLRSRLQQELPLLSKRLTRIFDHYTKEKIEALARAASVTEGEDTQIDNGGVDTFFAWFFRGDGPAKIVSGANLQKRFGQRSGAYATFFEDNYVAVVLGCSPVDVPGRLAEVLGVGAEHMQMELSRRSRRFLTPVKKNARADHIEAVQGAAIEWLRDTPGPHHNLALIIWQERFEPRLQRVHADLAPGIGDGLCMRTFFTELRERPGLLERLWPHSEFDAAVDNPDTVRRAFRERDLRGQMLIAAARLGHAFIDLYVLSMRRLGSFRQGTREHAEDSESSALELERIHEYLDLLDNQRRLPITERGWRAFDELADIADNFDLLLDVNEPDARHATRSECTRSFAQLFGRQQPVGGMSGQINRTMVRQFRMPGYPLVLVTTELLQEGEDLHTFCSSIQHYGISWTPSAMEQRIGRIDRVRSQTDRRLAALTEPLAGVHKLQIFFPHLQDTVEVLQVRRVLARMDTFLRMVHEGFGAVPIRDDRKINIAREAITGIRPLPADEHPLRTAFPVRVEDLVGEVTRLAVDAKHAKGIEDRFQGLARLALSGLKVEWETGTSRGRLFGTVRLAKRQQPFTLLLRSFGEHIVVRCISPVGLVSPSRNQNTLQRSLEDRSVRIGATATGKVESYDFTVEDDVLLAVDTASDAGRVTMLLTRVTQEADRLELTHLNRDERMERFRRDLEQEAHHES